MAESMKQFRINGTVAVLLAALLAGLAGCVTSPHAAGLNGDPGAICHVCRYNNDLACVCVKVDEKTPRAEYQGKTYYFCSDDCRTAFLKNTAKYLPKEPQSH